MVIHKLEVHDVSQHLPEEDQATAKTTGKYKKNLMTIGHVVPEISRWTDGQTHKLLDHTASVWATGIIFSS